MITVRIESLSEYGPNVFMESFNTPMQALVYLTGYIDAAPINITRMSVVDHLDSKREQLTPKTAQEWREAIWPTKWACCPPPEEKEPLDPVFPLCMMCPDPADIVCRVTPNSPGLSVCNRCHKGEGFRYITNCYDHHSAT